MSIDIDKGFKKVSELRFYEIKKRISRKKDSRPGPLAIEKKQTARRGRYRLRKETEETLRKAKKLLIDGQNCKSVAYEIGKNLKTIQDLIKRHTGLTMCQFQKQYKEKPQQ